MIRLNVSPEPRWFDLLPGLRIKALPVTTAVMASARADAALDDLDPDEPQEILAVAMAKAVARRIVLQWEGVGDADGEPLALSPEGVDALLDMWPVFEAFQAQVLGPHLMLESEKNDSAPSPAGTSAGATDTVKPARRAARTARKK